MGEVGLLAQGGFVIVRRKIVILVAAVFAAVVGPPVVAPQASRAAVGTDVADMNFQGLDREPLGSPGHYVGVGLSARVGFWDSDLPPELGRWGVRVRSTSDPVGLVLLTRRTMRADPYYSANFRFSTTATDQRTAELLVADGDRVTFSYDDVANSTGSSRTVEKSTTWRAGSAQPDSRNLVFSTADPAAPVVFGDFAVAPGAAVTVYDTSAGGAAVATGTADARGSFAVDVPRRSPVPSQLWVTAREAAAVESPRVAVGRARLTGRVVYPDAAATSVTNALLVLSGPHYMPRLFITNAGGRISMSNNGIGTGAFDVYARPQGGLYQPVPVPAPGAAAFGPSGTYSAAITDLDVTADFGEIRLAGPNFSVTVTANGRPLPEADVLAATLDHEVTRGGYTDVDGRLALHLPDGDQQLHVWPPYGCGERRATISNVFSVRDGVSVPFGTLAVDLPLDPRSVERGLEVTVVPGPPPAVDVDPPLLVDYPADGPGTAPRACRPAAPPAGIVAVGSGVDLEGPGFDSQQGLVCLGYSQSQLTAAGVDPAAIELYELTPAGGAVAVTTRRDVVGREVCGHATALTRFALGVGPAVVPPKATTVPVASTAPTTPVPPGATAPPTGPAPVPAPASAGSGYWMVRADGAVYAFGASPWLGAPAGGATVDLEPTPSGRGYWVVDAAGGVSAFGDAVMPRPAGPLAPGETVTSLSATATGRGYWLFTTSGRVLPFGDAPFLGDMSGTRLNGPVLDSIPTPTGRGYYLVASDGGIFAFGDAAFVGSMGGRKLNAPVESLVPDGDGNGYWLVAADGGVFAFAAPFRGSMGAVRLNAPMAGMVRYGNGYLMVGADGGIFNFSDRPFLGSLGGSPQAQPIVSVASLP